MHELDKSQLLGCVDDLIYSISDTQMKLAETIEFVGVSKCFYDNHNTTPLVRVYEMSDDGIFVLPKDRNSDLEWINDTWSIMAIILFYYKKTLILKAMIQSLLLEVLDKKKFKAIVTKNIFMG